MRISLAMILLCVMMIAMLSLISLMQLKESVEKERNASIVSTTIQTGLSFSYISDDIEHYLFDIIRSEGIASVMAFPTSTGSRALQITHFLQSITDSTYYVQSAYLINEEDGNIFTYSGADALISPSEFEKKYQEGLFDTPKDTQWFQDDQGYLYVSRAIYRMYPYKRIGCLIVQINQESMFAMTGIHGISEGTLCIFDADHNMVIEWGSEAENRELLLTAYSAGIQNMDAMDSVRYGGEEYNLYIHSQGATGWHVMFLISQKEKLASYYKMNSSITAISIVLIAMSLVLSYVISYSLTKKTSRMMRQIQHIGENHPEERISIGGKDEIAELAGSFNEMLDKIEDMYQQILNQQIERDNVRYELLDLQFRSIQAQIAPHFISNILGALNSYAAAGETDKVEQLVVHASRYIRRNMDSIDKKMSTVDEEFRTIDEYIALYQNVFGEPQVYKKRFVDEECRTMMMPSLLLQPLVENALKYFRNDDNAEQTQIYLTAQHTKDRLLLCVEDSSGALPQDVLDAVGQMMAKGTDFSNRLGFGLSGIIRRLAILYPDQYTFQVFSLPKNHKRIEICIPAVTDEEYYETEVQNDRNSNQK